MASGALAAPPDTRSQTPRPSLATAQTRVAAIPCASLCMSCGRLDPPSHALGYRAAAPGPRARTCAHCHDTALVDLASTHSVQLVLDLDEQERLARGSPGRRLARRGVLIAAASVFAAVILLVVFMTSITMGRGDQVRLPLAVLGAIVVGGPMVLVGVRHAVRLWQRTAARPLPARWFFPTPPRGRRRVLNSGPLTSDEDPLVAPLTGRPCLAYEVRARWDDPGNDEPLGRWLLLEQRSAPARVGAHGLARDGVFLQLERERVTLPASGGPRDRADAYLRSRGFLAVGVPVRLYESIVRPGDVVTLLGADAPTVLRA